MRHFRHPLIILMLLLLLPLSGWASAGMSCAQIPLSQPHCDTHHADHHDHAMAVQHHEQNHKHHTGLSCGDCAQCMVCHSPAVFLQTILIPTTVLASTILVVTNRSTLPSYIPDFPDRPPRA